MSRLAWSFNFTATAETAAAAGAAYVSDRVPLLGLTDSDAQAVAASVDFGVLQAVAIAAQLGLDTFFAELTGRVRPDPDSRSGAGLGVFVSSPLPSQ